MSSDTSASADTSSPSVETNSNSSSSSSPPPSSSLSSSANDSSSSSSSSPEIYPKLMSGMRSSLSSLSPDRRSKYDEFLSLTSEWRAKHEAAQRDFLRQERKQKGEEDTKERLQADDEYVLLNRHYGTLRWLNSVDWSVDTAVKRYNKSMEWRDREKQDYILLHRPAKQDLSYRVCPRAVVSHSKGNYCSYFERSGSTHMDGMIQLFDYPSKEFLRTHMYELEEMMRASWEMSVKIGEWRETSVNVLDLKGLGIHHRKGVKYMIDAMVVDQENYPECLERLYVVNTTRIFPALYALVKPFLDKKVVEKLVIVGGGNPLPHLLKDFEPDHLPRFLGGTMEDPPSLVVYSQSEIKKYINASSTSGSHTEDLTQLRIPAGKKVTQTLKAKEKGTSFCWYVETKKGDLGVSITFTEDGKEGKEGTIAVFPYERKATNQFAFQGEFDAPSAGTLTVVFDNSYSYFTAKNVSYYMSSSDVTEITEEEKKQLEVGRQTAGRETKEDDEEEKEKQEEKEEKKE